MSAQNWARRPALSCVSYHSQAYNAKYSVFLATHTLFSLTLANKEYIITTNVSWLGVVERVDARIACPPVFVYD